MPSIHSRMVANQRLAEQVRSRICELGYSQLRTIRCAACESTAILSGRLDCYYLSQVAQCVAAKTPGVHRVVNRLDVVPASGPVASRA